MNMQNAMIRCRECACARLYTGPRLVGDKQCDECKHPLRDHTNDGEATYALDSSRRMPDGFERPPQFE